MISLDIFADPVCPWSLIAKTRLERALAARPDHPFILVWQPFQLNPTLPAAGMERQAYLRARFGAGASRADLPLIEATQALSIPLNLAAIRRVPNTTDAHRLLHWAGLEGCQSAVMTGLMRGYWCEGRDLGQADTLAAIAADAGMDPALVRRLLATDADRDTVAAREAHARERGIDATPSFVLGNDYVIAGAQDEAFWSDVIADLAGPAPAETRH